MNRNELILATAIVLFVAFVLGWFANWLIHRVTRVTRAEVGELDRMARALHEAEDSRDRTVTAARQRETDLENQLSQTEAELRAAMDGLRDARHETEELRAWIERQNAG